MKSFTSLIKAYKTTATESNFAFFTFLKLIIQVENDWHLFYLPYQLSDHLQKKVLNIFVIIKN